VHALDSSWWTLPCAGGSAQTTYNGRGVTLTGGHCRAKIISPPYAALVRLKWFVGKEDVLRELLLEVIRSNDFHAFLLPEWYACRP
jgi:hypothetical protein